MMANPFADGLSLRLLPALATIAEASEVQLRAGDETIFVIPSESPVALRDFLELCRVSHRDVPHSETLATEYTTALHQQLFDAGLLVDASIEDTPHGRYWMHWPRTLRGGPARPPSGKIVVFSPDEIGLTLVTVLNAHGFQTNLTPAPVDLTSRAGELAWVVACETPHFSFMLECNRLAANHNVPCLFVDLSHGRHATIGPMFLPGEGSCYACFRRRWREGSSSRSELETAERTMLATRQPLPAYGCLPAFRYGAAAWVAIELAALAVGHRPLNTLNRALTIDWEGMSNWLEPAWRFPWCEVCGATTPRQPWNNQPRQSSHGG